MSFRWLILSSAPQDGGQINQATRPSTFRFDFGAAAVFDAQIIQARVAFDDGFRAFSFWLNGGLAFRALKTISSA
jgi:hypothetical protein